MAVFSFIDKSNKDFLRNEDGRIIMISTDTLEAAKNWLLNNGKKYARTKTARFSCFNWAEEFPEFSPITSR